MLRKSWALVAVVIGTTCLGIDGAASGRTGSPEGIGGLDRMPPYVHVVIFHLKKDSPPGEADALITDANDLLRPIPSVRDLRIGPPAVKAKPDRARGDYQVGLLVLFDNQQGLDLYLMHPNHLKFVEKHSKYLTDQLAVYDFIEQKK
jgi:hypothetical protein